MILRRAENLSIADNVRLDGVLWNVARVAKSKGKVEVRLTRAVGSTKDLELLPDDMVLLDY